MDSEPKSKFGTVASRKCNRELSRPNSRQSAHCSSQLPTRHMFLPPSLLGSSSRPAVLPTLLSFLCLALWCRPGLPKPAPLRIPVVVSKQHRCPGMVGPKVLPDLRTAQSVSSPGSLEPVPSVACRPDGMPTVTLPSGFPLSTLSMRSSRLLMCNWCNRITSCM